MVPRSIWRGAYQASEVGPVRIEPFEAFGWNGTRHTLAPGAAVITIARQVIDRASAPNLTFYVRGLATVTEADGDVLDDRVPGMFSGERPDHPQGIFTVRAVDETEFWCFNWHGNRRALPALTPIRAEDGETVPLDAGAMVLVCLGQLGDHAAGEAFVAGSSLVAQGKTYGLIIGGARG